ncbi:MAG TPA: hypothetical protein VGO29_07295 [Solirubrobacteraceae bacterium]|nr:hypothetical protein [Solirubrobacteraceae bacterium]
MTSQSGRVTDAPARAVFALLVVACFVAFFLTQHLKHTPTVVQLFKLTPRFSPTPAGHIKRERISFRLARADEATVTIVDAAGATVATLLRDHAIERYKQFSLRWTGKLGTARGYALVAGPNGRAALQPKLPGPLAPAGEYRVRVTLRAQHRTVTSPRSFMLVRP